MHAHRIEYEIFAKEQALISHNSLTNILNYAFEIVNQSIDRLWVPSKFDV